MDQANKRKIIICVNNLKKGGTEKQVSYISNYLIKFYKIKIFMLENEKVEYFFNKNIQIIKSNYKSIVIYKFLIELILSKKNIIFYFLPKPYLVFGYLSIFFSKNKKIMFRRSLNYYQKNKFLLKKMELLLHKFTDFFICNSYASKKQMINEEKIDIKRIATIYNFINKKEIKPNLAKTKTFNFLCVANFYYYKNYFLILKVMYNLNKKIKNWKLYIIGSSRDFGKEKIISIAKNLNIEKKIIFLKKNSSKLNYPFIKFGLLFSEYESLPNSIIEYMQNKLPILTRNTGDIKKISNKCAYIFNKNNERIIASKIYNLIENKKYKTMSKLTNKKMFLFSKKNTLDQLHRLLVTKFTI